MIELTAAPDCAVQIGETVDGVCHCCDEERDVAQLRTVRDGEVRGDLLVCGVCIAAALAVRFAAAGAGLEL